MYRITFSFLVNKTVANSFRSAPKSDIPECEDQFALQVEAGVKSTFKNDDFSEEHYNVLDSVKLERVST